MRGPPSFDDKLVPETERAEKFDKCDTSLEFEFLRTASCWLPEGLRGGSAGDSCDDSDNCEA